MSELIKRGGENKFFVFKREDIERIPSDTTRSIVKDGLRLAGVATSQLRHHTGRNPYPEYLVINLDEPYAPEVIEIMKRHGHWGTSSPEEPKRRHLAPEERGI